MKISLLFLLPLAAIAQTPAPLAEIPAPKEPSNSGPVKLVAASWLGGPDSDEIIGVTLAPDGTITLGENGIDIKVSGITPTVLGRSAGDAVVPVGNPKKKSQEKASPATGYVIRLSADGSKISGITELPFASLDRLRGDEQGNIYILGKAKGQLEIGGQTGSGTFVAQLTPDAKQAKWAIFHPGAVDFGVDGNGEVVILTKGRMTRFKPGDNTQVWQVSMPSHGDNRPGGMVVVPSTGVAAATGYGMAHTGHEPYKDPYAYGFDRAGKQLWALWNPDPKLEAAAQFGGNGLMADTSGMFCATDGKDKIYIALRSDGGNTISSRDPSDPFKPLDPSVLSGVFQSGPGFGFKGASMSSVIFRVDPPTGKLEKGTFMTAWLTPGRANGLMINDAAGALPYQFVVGGSAAGFKSKDPWYEAPAGGYKGGGFLAVFDPQFKMLQSGYFPGSGINCVAARNGTVVIAGSASGKVTSSDKSVKDSPDITYGVPTYKPVQPAFAGGKQDGYFAIFKAPK
jgi:hypothetical protein